MEDKPLQLQLLGAFEVRADGRVIIDSAWPNRRAATLLKLLAINGGSLHRDQIYEALWPQSETVAAAGSLRRCLYQLRAALNGDASQPVLSSEPDRVVLDGGVEVDVDVFLRLAQEARAGRTDAERFDQALAAYTGDLLPGDLYEEWAEPLRSELREQRKRLLLEAALLHESEGRSQEAEEYLRRLIAIDAAHEAAHCALMRVYAASGQRDRALRQYQRCVEALSRELDAKPSEQTEALYRQIKGTDQPLPAPASLQSPDQEAKIIPLRPSLGDATGEDDLVGQSGSRPEEEARGLRRLWENRAVRVAAAVLALAVIGGGAAGGMFVNGAIGGGSSAANAYQRIDFHTETRWTLRPAGGDCESTDLVFSGQASADNSGDLTDPATGPAESTLYASDNCQWGYSRATFTGSTEQAGNTLSLVVEAPATAGTGEGLGFALVGVPIPIMYTGGTGIYEGATGHGRCLGTTAANTNPDGGVIVLSEGDCTTLMAIGPEAAGVEPVILELGAGLIRMAVFSSAVDLPKKAYFSVLYMNTRYEPQTGLSLKLRSPEGAEIIAAERGEEGPAAGERVWRLPDLAPREVGRFQFSVTFVSANTEAVDLVAEIEGDGFDEPVRSYPLTIEVVQ